MKQKIIAIVSSLAVIGFLGKNQIASLTSKYITHSDTTVAMTTESITPSASDIGVDTILQKSMRSIQSVGEKNLKSDSLIVTRVEKTVTQIQNLNHEVKVLKKENKALRAKLNDTDNVDGHFGLLPISAEIGE
jgi:hypothetical protein